MRTTSICDTNSSSRLRREQDPTVQRKRETHAVAQIRRFRRMINLSAMALKVRHFPPGTSKWNKIEHRLFAYITRNWRGQPLITHAAIVNLIAATKTSAGLKVRCELDRRQYQKGLEVSDEQLAQVRIERDEFHGDWNYTIRPT